MLFNSFGFLFLYLPAVLAGYFLLGRVHARWAAAWLAAASLFFYGYWDVRFLPLLLASICGNYCAGLLIARAHGPARKRRLCGALCANLLLLAYYKYANFFAAALMEPGADWRGWDIVLPIGISFFTFTQIAFLVDCYRGEVRDGNFIHYMLFVSYFPHLVAGPVLHHKEMMPQFADPDNARPRSANFAVGLSIFVLGLAKKVLLADTLAPLAAPVFAAGAHPQLVEAWTGVLAYSFQLYFDFSGYSDMAIGLSLLFGVRLPLNFNSPYKARNISEFWRRWHMTLSRFLRDYLYIALGGNRAGRARRYANLMATMVLGGLWHGAGWTFVAWGAMHGGYLVLHQGWLRWRGAAASAPAWWGAPLTFLAVMLAWVVFRAPDLATAGDLLGALAGANGVSLPRALQGVAAPLAQLGMHPEFKGLRWMELDGPGLPVLLLSAVLAFAAPNTQEIFCHYQPCIERIFRTMPGRAWRPSPGWGLALAALFISCVFNMNRVSEFLYFQF
ncbi:MBOAT family O-acyltransferase [Pseudoduganella aquatica]|uniref:MBOAT family O-acyltransferase n=1 Tax=Pseudoduganella aquatica TaxID=2660641 RepID=UPI001E5F3FA8|nr:MBOAT family protein [Pseudoduganella aquatica]